MRSHPTRGAWIEIIDKLQAAYIIISSHPTRGAWIEIVTITGLNYQVKCRTPHGVRGLKLERRAGEVSIETSHPTRGAWIEIGYAIQKEGGIRKSHPTRGAWIEIRR